MYFHSPRLTSLPVIIATPRDASMFERSPILTVRESRLLSHSLGGSAEDMGHVQTRGPRRALGHNSTTRCGDYDGDGQTDLASRVLQAFPYVD